MRQTAAPPDHGSGLAGALVGLGLPGPDQVTGLDDDTVVGLAVDVEVLGRQVDALRAVVAGEIAERSRPGLGPDGLAQRLGCRNGVELVQRTTGASGASVNRRIRLGRATRASTGLSGAVVPARFPGVAEALGAARLGVDAACAVVDTLSPAVAVAGSAAVQAAEREIVAGAQAPDPAGPALLDADSVRLQATVWRTVLDPDGTAPSEHDAQRRFLRVSPPRHGLVPVNGLLLPEVAAALHRYAHACTNPRTNPLASPPGTRPSPPGSPASDPTTPTGGANDPASATGGARDRTNPPTSTPAPQASTPAPVDDWLETSDRRSGPQRLHDVLATIVQVAARAADAPSVAGTPPTLVVAVRARDLATDRGAAFVEDSPTPISLTTARHTGCTGAIQRLVLADNGRILQLGSPERCFTGPQRRAIALRDGGCVIPGCHVPVGWCEVHHVTPHAHDPGGTHTDNGVLVCWFHHRTLERSGWAIRMRDGIPQVKAPPWLDPTSTWRTATTSPARIADTHTTPLVATPDTRRCA